MPYRYIVFGELIDVIFHHIDSLLVLYTDHTYVLGPGKTQPSIKTTYFALNIPTVPPLLRGESSSSGLKLSD
jgi:hypothetical protein